MQSFNDSGSEAGLSDSMGYDATKRYSLNSSRRVSSPEQQVFIVAAPSRQVNFEDMEVCRHVYIIIDDHGFRPGHTRAKMKVVF